ncbi:Hpt domain-containing protein [Zestomonas thermotolerans]|uniref:Hpt domain-containing protein n=1 Tax=Zestomonas thermotolerans TaxID=157784 RepID=UPI00035C1F47|nr:Hpt domain-containing protein [Pseudomonas thermotolerans]MBO2511280.1 Hpt domain-containing protein [Gammaproteobacteria bacterium]
MDDQHLDNAVLLGLQEVMEDEYPQLLETFINDSRDRLGTLQQALGAADAQTLRLAAHSFKGSCSNMGAPLLAGLCRQLEDAARRECLEEVPALLERIAAEFAIVSIRLKGELQRHRFG